MIKKNDLYNWKSTQKSSVIIYWVIFIVLLSMGLLLWEVLVRAGKISAMFFPAPTDILINMLDLIKNGELFPHLRATFYRLFFGLFWGSLVGVILGLILGWSKNLRSVIDPVVAALHPLPKISILPLIIVLFGIGEISKVIVIAIACFFPMLINTMAGVRNISSIYFEVAENYGAKLPKLFYRVILPASLPMIMTGLRITFNTAFHVTIAAELVAANEGLGALIWLSWEVLRIKNLYASLVFIALLGILSNLIIIIMTHRLVPWREPSIS